MRLHLSKYKKKITTCRGLPLTTRPINARFSSFRPLGKPLPTPSPLLIGDSHAPIYEASAHECWTSLLWVPFRVVTGLVYTFSSRCFWACVYLFESFLLGFRPKLELPLPGHDVVHVLPAEATVSRRLARVPRTDSFRTQSNEQQRRRLADASQASLELIHSRHNPRQQDKPTIKRSDLGKTSTSKLVRFFHSVCRDSNPRSKQPHSFRVYPLKHRGDRCFLLWKMHHEDDKHFPK